MKTLINLSGGVDSTFALYQFLRQNKKEPVLVHFCHLINNEGREPFEAKAVKNILNWFRSKKVDRIKFIDSMFDYRSLGFITHDVELIQWFAATIARAPNYRSIENIIISVNKDERDSIGPGYPPRMARRKELVELVAERPINFLYPIVHMTKREIIEQLPSELFEMTWYCRTPKHSKPCGKCKTCILVNRSVK